MDRTNHLWKPELYKLQLEAPTPNAVLATGTGDRQKCFGAEYHGIVSHRRAASLLRDEPNGSFLVRKGSENNRFFTLSWKFNDEISHFKLFYDGRYYVKEKRYDSMYELMADGLILKHIELHGTHITEMMHEKVAYQESPYVTLNRKRLKAISRKNKPKNLIVVPNDCTESNRNEVKNCRSRVVAVAVRDSSDDSAKLLNETDGDTETFIDKYSRDHSFKVRTFKGLNWCEFCANFLWGFTAQGVKCEDCGFVAHAKCSKLVPGHCMPDLKKTRGVFGIDLTTLLNVHSGPLPFVVTKCIREIETRGMEQEGIYRVSGFADEIEALKMALDTDGEAAHLENYSNINVIAGCLKLYLRLLPVPLLTHQLHSKLMETSHSKSATHQVEALRETLTGLPPAHYNTLQYVMQHLHRVSLLADVNKMTSHNLSTVFAPTLMAVPSQSTDLSREIHILEILISNSPKIFAPKG